MDVEVDDSLYITEQRSSGEQTSEEEEPAQLIVFYPNRQPVPYRLHVGVNVIGRQSSFAQRDAMRLHQWSLDYDGVNVHGIFLESSSVSSAHAVIFLEAWGDCCFVKDLKSRNKTFVRRGGKHVAIEPQQKHPLYSGDSLTFGALKCRVAFGGSSEGGTPPPGPSPTARAYGLSAGTRAVSIGQRTASPGTPSGRAHSLDKCPSLQEWMQHPARSASSGGPHAQPSPFSGAPMGRGWQEDENGTTSTPPLELPARHSFGFGLTIHEADENTSSDAEPETPRIDRPAALSPVRRPKQTPFAAAPSSSLAPTPEAVEEGDAAALGNEALQDKAANNAAEEPSMELGAETLAQLKAVPLKGLLVGDAQAASPPQSPPTSLPGTPGTADFNTPPISSPEPSQGGPSPRVAKTAPAEALSGEEEALASGRPIRGRHKSPTTKRSRSGRLLSPDKSQPRSKSPRLQRGFFVDTDATPSGERHLKLDEIRDAVHDIWTDM